jgi:hypothetical protein
MTVQALKRRFDELLDRLDKMTMKNWPAGGGSLSSPAYSADSELFRGWRLNASNLLMQVCGKESRHYKEFESIERTMGFKTIDEFVRGLRAVFVATKDDYEGGYLRSFRSFVHAELFDDELEQATELLASGYTAAAAVVARVVLETTLRTLCDDCNPVIEVRKPNGKWVSLEDLNIALAKASVYTVAVQEEVTSLAAIGNDAAHGHPPNEAKVESMITQVRRFMTEHPIK